MRTPSSILFAAIWTTQLCRIELRRRIPDVLLQIGTPQAARALADNILQADSVLRFRIISALNKLQELHKHPPLDRGLIETVMVAEIMGHYRSYQILGSLRNHADELLRQSMGREVERIFRLMKFLFPSIDLQNAYRGIQSAIMQLMRMRWSFSRTRSVRQCERFCSR